MVTKPRLRVEVWSDVVCPWCYLGKRRLTSALARFEHRDAVEVMWHSFQLNPSQPRGATETLNEMLAAKYGMTREQALGAHARLESLGAVEGIVYDFDAGHPANTFDAHRLLHLAQASGLADQAHERLFAAYFTEGRRIDDPATLAELASEIGLDEEAARELLSGDAYAAEVAADLREAHELGLGGAPAFVIDRRYLISGAQEVDLMTAALNEAWDAAHDSTEHSPTS